MVVQVKRYLKKFEGLTPETWWLDRGTTVSWESIKAECMQRGWHKGFIKPCVGACSWGTLRFDLDEDSFLKFNMRS